MIPFVHINRDSFLYFSQQDYLHILSEPKLLQQKIEKPSQQPVSLAWHEDWK